MSEVCRIGHLVSLKKAYIIFLNGKDFPRVKWVKGAYEYNGMEKQVKMYECNILGYKTKMELIGDMYSNNAMFHYTTDLKGTKLNLKLFPLLPPERS